MTSIKTATDGALAVNDKPVDVIKWNAYAVEAETFARSALITDDLSAARVTEGAKRIKTFGKEVDEARKETRKPFAEMVLRIDAAFKPITEALAIAEAKLKQKLSNYLEEQEKERRIEEERQRQEFEKKKDDMVARSVFDGEDPEAMAAITDRSVPDAILPKTGIRTSGALASQKKTWDFEITDEQKVPRLFLMVNEKAIGAAVRSGVRTIEGVRIFEKTGISIR